MARLCMKLHGLLAVMTLVFAVFVATPMVDAATCAPEPPSAHGYVAHESGQGDHSDKGGQHGVCAHGHCHHGGGAMKLNDVEIQAPSLSARLRPQSDHLVLTPVPGGLERPPRA